jgi:putative tricarboxylic transport membrane protein
MRVAALVLGLLGGLLAGAGLFGYMRGEAGIWLQLAAIALPLASMIGGGVSLLHPLGGAILMMVGAYGFLSLATLNALGALKLAPFGFSFGSLSINLGLFTWEKVTVSYYFVAFVLSGLGAVYALASTHKIDNTKFWSGLAALALSVFVVCSGYQLKLGTINEPGSGFVIFYAGLLMILFSVIILYEAIEDGGPTFLSHWRDVLWTKPLIVIVLLVAFTFVFELAGFVTSTTLLLMALLRAIDPVPWRRAVPIALLVPLTCWFALQKLLKIQLPSSILDSWYLYVVELLLLPLVLVFDAAKALLIQLFG